MMTLARRGAALAVAAVAVAGAVSPAAAEGTATTVAASAFRQGAHDNIAGQWAVSESANAPWPADSTSTGSAYSGSPGQGADHAWLVEFRLPSRLTCGVVSAQVSIRPVDQVLFDPFSPPDPPFAENGVSVYAGNGGPTASSFDQASVGSQTVTPTDDSPLTLDFTDAVATLVDGGSTFAGVRVRSAANGYTNWDAPMDQPDTRPSLSVVCGPVGPDDDHDGVANTDDICAKTVLPDKINSLSKVKYAATANGVFRSGAGLSSGLSLDDTAGCSAIQIGQRLGPVVELDVRLWGLALNRLQKWAATH